MKIEGKQGETTNIPNHHQNAMTGQEQLRECLWNGRREENIVGKVEPQSS